MLTEPIDLNAFFDSREKVEKTIGPCTHALKEDMERTGYYNINDNLKLALLPLWIKANREQESRLVQWEAVLGDGSEAAFRINRLVEGFQFFSDELLIHTTSPQAFFFDLQNHINEITSSGSDQISEELRAKHLATSAVLYLLAITDDGCIFDRSIVEAMPLFFCSKSLAAGLLEDGQVDEEEYAMIMNQVRAFQAMGRQSRQYVAHLDRNTLPLAHSLLRRSKLYMRYVELKDIPQNRISKEKKRQLILAIGKSFVFYFGCEIEIGRKNQDADRSKYNQLQRKVTSLTQGDRDIWSDAFFKGLEVIIDSMIQEGCLPIAPFYSFTIIRDQFATIRDGVELSTPSQIVKDILSVGPQEEVQSDDATAKKRFRSDLCLFRKLCTELRGPLPALNFDKSQYLLELTQGYTPEHYPSDRIMKLEPSDAGVVDYLTRGMNNGDPLYREMNELLKFVPANMELSPFQLTEYRNWSVSEEELYEYLNSKKTKTEEKKKGPSQTRRKMINRILENAFKNEEVVEKILQIHFAQSEYLFTDYGTNETMEKTEEIMKNWTASTSQRLKIDGLLCADPFYKKKKKKGEVYPLLNLYYHHCFLDDFSYGSGIETTAWTMQLAAICDVIIREYSLGDVIPEDNHREQKFELLELGIHTCILHKINEIIQRVVCSIGKRVFYTPDILSDAIAGLDEILYS